MIQSLTLKQWRCVREMKQDEVAKKLGVSVTTLSNWETGKNFPSLQFAIKLMHIYNIQNIDDVRFLCEEGSDKPNEDMGE